MTIAFSRLFTTEGYTAGGLNEVNTWRGTTLPARVSTLTTQLETSTVYNALVSGLQTTETAAQQADNGYAQALSTLALNALSAEVIADRPLNGTGLTALLTELVRQLNIASDTVQAAPSGVTAANIGSPVGDTSFVWGLWEGLTGGLSDYIIPEVINTNCTQDRSTGATAYQERFSIQGTPATTPTTSQAYPTGSGTNVTATALDPAVSGGLVADPAFLKWGVSPNQNVPSVWSIYSGTAGTNIIQATSDPRSTGASCLNLVGDGTTIPKVRIPVSVNANSIYAVSLRTYKVVDSGANHWAVSLFLTNSAGTSVTGNAAYANELDSASSATMTGSWANVVNGIFLTPAVLPVGGCFLEVRMHRVSANTTAPDASASVYVDYVPMVQQTQLYAGGPTFQAISGQTAAAVGDQRKATFALTTGGQTCSSSLIRMLDRLLGLASITTVRIPTTTSSPTFADTLVT